MEKFAFIQNPCLLALVAACFPLLTFAEILAFGKPGKGSSTAISYSWLSFLLSGYVFLMIWNRQEFHQQVTWFTMGEIRFTAGILLNNLSVLMLLLISLVALLVQVYSAGYMKNEPLLHRYWAYLGLFCFAMMALVIVDNLLLLYFAWELVGFSSYLLIGFWTSRESAIRANKKAFLMNRIGDLGFLAGILIIYLQFQTLDIPRLFGEQGLVKQAVVYNHVWISVTNQLPSTWLTVAGLSFFFGAMAKSAQFPLHTWLPDAMEGPTPVSSLLHAATMVAAGVFLLVRISPLFNDNALVFIAGTGAFTAFFAASCAMVQTDLKRILAWSTVSQLGFMVLAVGTGSNPGAIFHLATHAFFKCLLFLAAGSVIHALHRRSEQDQQHLDPQDIRNMGGLRHSLPFTFVVMLIAAYALAGMPLSSGFLSKDAILVHVAEWAENRGGATFLFPVLAFTTSMFTSFYISRLILVVFFGPADGTATPIKEANILMKLAMGVLAAGCLYPVFTAGFNLFQTSWITAGISPAGVTPDTGDYAPLLPILVTAGNLAAFALAVYLFGKKQHHKTALPGAVSRFMLNGWYIDSVYDALLIKPLIAFSTLVSRFDKTVIDGVVHTSGHTVLFLARVSAGIDVIVNAAVDFMGSLSKSIGNFARRFQSGRIQYYLSITITVLLLFFILQYFVR